MAEFCKYEDEDEREIDHDKHFTVKIVGKAAVADVASFDDPVLRLNKKLLENLKAKGLETPTPIQAHGMPQIMAKVDTMCSSCTGSGKTAAYLLPIVNMITEGPSGSKGSRSPKALILSPTRELAEQICEDARDFCKGLPVNVLAIFGGDSIGEELKQLRKKRIDIVVATPGRLYHLLTEFTGQPLKLEGTEILVIDEADEMFNRNFFPQINAIVKDHMKPKEERLTAMFSATFPLQIRKYAKRHLRENYVIVLVGTLGGASPDIIQEIIPATQSEKLLVLLDMIAKEPEKKMLVFCNTIDRVDSLTGCLKKKNVSVAKIHSDLTQWERNEILEKFHLGKVMVLVATSVAARGLNINNVAIVVNYELPTDIEHYVQRIGRARKVNDNFGIARSFYDEATDLDIVDDLKLALSSTNQPIPEFLSENTQTADDEQRVGNEDSNEVDAMQLWMAYRYKKAEIRAPDYFSDPDGF